MTDGLLLIDKPAGPTSHDIVDGIRRALGGVRCGHAGTLDPFASGLLVVAIGRATRLLRFLSGSDKSYEGIVRLGFATDTDDATGRQLGERNSVDLAPGALSTALVSLEGEFEQVSPSFSARKHEGVPLYRLARRGREVPSRTAKVRVRWDRCEPIAPDRIGIRVSVSAGTYIRALARDLGAALGCGAHLAELRRLTSEPFRVEEALPFPCEPLALERALIPVDAIPLRMPAVTLDAETSRLVRAGARWPAGSGGAWGSPDPGAPPWVRLLDASGRLLAVAELLDTPAGPVVQPRVVLAD